MYRKLYERDSHRTSYIDISFNICAKILSGSWFSHPSMNHIRSVHTIVKQKISRNRFINSQITTDRFKWWGDNFAPNSLFRILRFLILSSSTIMRITLVLILMQ